MKASETDATVHSRTLSWIGIGVVLAHLLLVALGAAYFDFARPGRPWQVLAFYGALSGATSSYGFFAPEVTGQYRVLFDVADAAGRETTLPLGPDLNGEATLRFGDIIDQFATESADADLAADDEATADAAVRDDEGDEVDDDDDTPALTAHAAVADHDERGRDDDDDDGAPAQKIGLSRALAASLAGAMFARHPEARTVRLRLEEFLPVDMAAYRSGRRPAWRPLYQATFALAVKGDPS
jgi:hypothetical protein